MNFLRNAWYMAGWADEIGEAGLSRRLFGKPLFLYRLENGSIAALQAVCAQWLPQLKAVTRGLLHYHLGSPVLRTRQVMLDVQSLDP